jgi:hypothetical protein
MGFRRAATKKTSVRRADFLAPNGVARVRVELDGAIRGNGIAAYLSAVGRCRPEIRTKVFLVKRILAITDDRPHLLYESVSDERFSK